MQRIDNYKGHKKSIWANMKYLFLGMFFSTILFTTAIGQNESNTGEYAVSIFSNGYAYPKIGDEVLQHISKQGITGWDDAGIYFRIFFYPQQTGEISVSVKLKCPSNNSTLKFQLDSTGKSYEVSINKSADYIIVPVGTFSINDVRYHFIDITSPTILTKL